MAGSQIIDVPGHGQVEFPESMSDADIVSAIQTLSPARTQRVPFDPVAGLKATQNTLGVGVPDAALSLGTGAVGQVAGGLAGLAQGAKNLFVDGGMPAGSRVEQVQNAMTYQPRSEAGQNILGGLDKMLGFIPRGADWAGEKTAEALGPAAGAAMNAGLQALPAVLTKVAKAPIAGALARAEQQAATDTALAAPRSAALLKGREMGLVASPAEANPSLVNRTAEGLAGQTKTQQLVSTKNQPKINEVVRKDVGLSPDTPLTIDALEAVRKQEGQAYERVRQAGDVKTDPSYNTALDKVEATFTGAEKDFPKMAQNDVRAAVNSARVDNFDAGSGVDAIKIQRGLADKAFRAGDNQLGKAHKAIADAIEGQIDRHLQVTGQSVDEFRAARKMIAKTYDVQQSLKGNNVDAKVLAKLLDKGRLTGGMKDVAEFAKQFPGAVQTGSKNAYAPTAWELGMGGVAAVGGLGLHAAGAGLPLAGGAIAAGAARPLLRSVITSSPYQNMMVRPQTFGPGLGLKAAGALSQNPALVGALSTIAAQRNKNH